MAAGVLALVLVLALLFALAAYLAVSIGIAKHAESKGYSFVGFFWFALFFMPFAIMTVTLAPIVRLSHQAAAPLASPEGLAPAPAQPDRESECRHCGQTLPRPEMLAHVRAYHSGAV